jgi:serine phosphatase RsbU (regulator of sigma subunit)/anti-sigma regulatory factor (Ser/Thr protein kinase)
MSPMLFFQMLLPAIVAALFVVADRKQAWFNQPYVKKQVIIGLAFGCVAIFATETGVPVVDGGVVNVRDAAATVAGLAFGPIAGVVAGVVGGVERWLCVYWGGGATTRLACSLGTAIAGLGAAALRKFVFEDRPPTVGYALAIGGTTEVLHMLLVLLTNLHDLNMAFAYVRECSTIMICLNAVASGLAVIGRSYINHERIAARPPHLIHDLGFRLFAIVLLAFLAVTNFTVLVLDALGADQAAGTLGDLDITEVILYLTVFMEILVHTALFIILFQLLRKRVVNSLVEVGEGLDAIARGNLDTVIDVREYAELSTLSDNVNTTVSALRGYIEEAEHRRDSELKLARQIQYSSLPNVFPPFPERNDFDLYASMNPAREVGGDFYDFFMLDNHTLVFLVADASGKGVPAAMFMMKAKTEIHALMNSGMAVDEALCEVNNRLCTENEQDMFVTMWLGKLNLSTGELAYGNAGHNPPLVKRADGSFELLREKRANFVLAGMENIKYRRNILQLGPCDKIFLYTDGVTEACSPQDELFGEDRLLETLNALDPKATPQQICEAVGGAVTNHANGAEQSDDVTMLAVNVYALRGRDRIVTCADRDSITYVHSFFEERLPRLGAGARVSNHVQVAVDEAYSNICNYSGATRAVATILRKGADLIVEFADDGVEFDPTQAAAPDLTLSVEERAIGGLGIHMMRKMSKAMSYARVDGINIFTITFELD